jgi:2-polyprenyl-6-methoxyphenol hydroxylase-like FAD-dependent oxidoreductase
MSPIGGVGVNLAVQDAVAAANILWQPLASGVVQREHVARVQKRRMLPTRVTQRLQLIIQDNVVGRVLDETQPLRAPLPLRLMSRYAVLRRLPARFLGLGVRPEHVQTPERAAT